MVMKRTLLVVSSLCSVAMTAQTVNKGGLYISPEGVMSTHYALENKEAADFKNNGTLYVYNDIVNNGAFFDFKGKQTQGTTIFKSDKQQNITGSSISKFNDVVLNNSTDDIAFNIINDVVVQGKVDFKDGIAKVDNTNGSFTFLKDAKAVNASDNSHIEGTVDKEGNNEFVFPIGDKKYYRNATITAPKDEKDIFIGKYNLDDTNFFNSHKHKSGVVELVNNREYWLVDRSSNVKSDVILSLGWHEDTTPKELLQSPEKNLRILRWDAKDQHWVDEGGIVDVSNKTVTTPTSVRGYGFFTLGTVNTDLILDGDVVIYNLVSPNGDGENDFFLIDNINRFPNNKVEIFNRWGVKVYETTSYDSHDNVFRGYSDGRVTISSGEKLPTGTYYYVISYEYRTASDARTIKKSGYLHLENN
ncbi:gliding motility-associated C-terminal domain-containing protein [Myroides marinus]|uniref:gliding motility-associated C-terminal domain-containing protein n=1 Tax=Myroides marinus TaxID=703342 RepID=UPI002575FD6C|nr:gliding motility-associated C-terminal domain-containing protein [Myroides marinus]MDM1346629.1 gliding motility-associated C-terminal domain-containing protein [Myroides marinus]MDM1350034.1 gliding motility-associated C-terminal domain-containing protein [Myroides marinus]MDM1357241.1 gliding motility-associated C-terminal domain-containing protein [Myroides marinus]MDM1364681.1 gliding motility-associated C-terminal domain-containing protein [Myroides marinus]